MLEVEIKASLAGLSPDTVARSAAEAGFRFQRSLREIDMYFDGVSRDFKQTDEALRLRSCRDLEGGGARTLLTYKGPKVDAASSTRTEYETSVGDLETARKLLEALGFRPRFTVDKTRREFTLEGVTLCLDTVAGLGSFLELESLTVSPERREAEVTRLLSLLDGLGVSRERLTRRSYLEMLLASNPDQERTV